MQLTSVQQFPPPDWQHAGGLLSQHKPQSQLLQLNVGAFEGLEEGDCVGTFVGANVGFDAVVGDFVAAVGDAVGSFVGGDGPGHPDDPDGPDGPLLPPVPWHSPFALCSVLHVAPSGHSPLEHARWHQLSLPALLHTPLHPLQPVTVHAWFVFPEWQPSMSPN